MLKRFSTDIAKGVAIVAGAEPPRTLVKMSVFHKAQKTCIRVKMGKKSIVQPMKFFAII